MKDYYVAILLLKQQITFQMDMQIGQTSMVGLVRLQPVFIALTTQEITKDMVLQFLIS